MQENESKKALIVGNEKYPVSPLRVCVKDAKAIQKVLVRHQDGTPNFSVRGKEVEIKENLSNKKLIREIELLLRETRKPQQALFYFAGHGYVDENGIGYLVGVDATKKDPGVPMDWLLEEFNKSSMPEITIILDCCFAGNFASTVSLRENITLLAATRGNDTSHEGPRHGFFTEILVKGLEGAAADVFGHVTATGLYKLASTHFSYWHQRPIFKAHLSRFTSLRKCKGLDEKDLPQLNSSEFFPHPNHSIGLRPYDIPADYNQQPQKAGFWRHLQRFEKAGLIECDDELSLTEAAQQAGVVRLSATGEYYWELLKNGRR